MSPSYEGQVVQTGPTAIYNLLDIEEGIVIEVALTMFRRNGDAVTVSEFINIREGEFPKKQLVVNETIQETESGKVIILDVLESTGPNIQWEKTEWLVDNQYKKNGSSVRIDVPASDSDRDIPYTCTFFRAGTEPEIYHGTVKVTESKIVPVISPSQLSSKNNNYYALDVLQSDGINIDWEKTEWYIYDGHENVQVKRGSKVTHAFAISQEQMGYQIMVVMYHQGGSKPYIGFKNIDIDGNELVPVLTWDVAEDDPNAYIFSAYDSTGANIDWTQTKWTFLDTTEAAYGPTVTHKFPVNSDGKTYSVALTIFRRLSNGTIESQTTTKEIKIGGDEIIPIVKAKAYGEYLVLSAEDSIGRGLLLDRSVWLFAGEGDSYSYSEHVQGGIISRSNFSLAGNQYIKNNINLYTHTQFGTQISFGAFALGSGSAFEIGDENGSFFRAGLRTDTDMGFSLEANESIAFDVQDYSGYTDENYSFSGSNMHTGTVCRKHVPAGQESVIVTLFVYRIESDGKMIGQSITVKIEMEDAKAQAGSGGVIYE
jgi:hypothetical protein